MKNKKKCSLLIGSFKPNQIVTKLLSSRRWTHVTQLHHGVGKYSLFGKYENIFVLLRVLFMMLIGVLSAGMQGIVMRYSVMESGKCHV